MLKILLIDDSAEYRQLIVHRLAGEFPTAEVVEYDPAQGLPDDEFGWQAFNLVLLDYDLGLTEENGLDWLRAFKAYSDMPPILMLTGEDSTRVAIDAMKLGADNYLLKKDVEGDALLGKLLEAAGHEQLEILAPDDESTQDPHETTLRDVDPAHETTYQNMPASEAAVATSEALALEIPGYRLIKEIGHGGMSTVVLGERLEDNIHVVLKIMFTRGMEDPTALKRFMLEYNLLSDIDHPHVVRIYERAFAADFAYIAMEYFPAGDLTKRIKEGIRPAEALEYLRQMASGLGAVHERGIVHRDIKPGNILFKDDGSLTITDFGVAKRGEEDMEDITVNNMIVGTPYYISPEQGSGMKVDNRSDLYSLGVIFFQMLTGKRPYSGHSVSELLRAHVVEPIPQLPEYLGKYQPLVDGLLAKDPDERFQTSRELLIGIDWKR
ncbi:DNA-binding NarL/FixJ family response regulator [Methylohalomonas lacus]|uniref:DNA-binding NarL/FixJ family response regulator n=1 Tax=Methylohalomonas lacus TaxID=398773 RepID=A0AAE3HL92_9GAMM|nr:protein kinase [Methylohalomonas lacus]MCS3902488.1 DNA-binding NarL/FixJ family response regulator [Methylohalomonas lacus]